MSYLEPPPLPAAVVVTKDVGGYVDQYRERTELYRAQDREVRLHECRSACTLALSLPNVCVYPDSVLKFHAAYDPRNRVINWEETQKLFSSYPAPVRARLGTLQREYKILSGAELISLGVRDCNEKRIMVAKAAPTPASSDNLAKIMQGMKSALLTGSETLGDTIGVRPATPAAPANRPSPLPVKTQPVSSPQSPPLPRRTRARRGAAAADPSRTSRRKQCPPPTCRCRRAGRLASSSPRRRSPRSRQRTGRWRDRPASCPTASRPMAT